MPRRDIAVPSWCRCGNCCKTPKLEEDVCCGQEECRSKEFRKHLETKLTKENLSSKLFKSPSKERKLSDMKLSDTGKMRRLCYEEASTFFHERKWYPQDDPTNEKYAALPSCIVWTIRRQYEEEERAAYTGFPPKDELLQKVMDAHKKFTDNMQEFKVIVELINQDSGLLTQIEKYSDSCVYDILTHHIGDPKEREKQVKEWGDSISKSKNLLPKFGFVACATTFETFVHDAIRRCVDTVFLTRTISESDKQYWAVEFQKWVKNRITEADGWEEKECEDEKSFWYKLIPSLASTPGITNQQESEKEIVSILKHLRDNPATVISELSLRENSEKRTENSEKRTSRSAIGLLQEIVNGKKQRILRKLTRPTWECIEETFMELVTEYMYSKVPSVVQVPQQGPSSNKSSEISRKRKTPSGTERKAIRKLCKSYVNKNTWNIWPYPRDTTTNHNVRCETSYNLTYLTELFYGLRCIFSHGTPEKTTETGSLSRDMTSTKSSHFGIKVLDRSTSNEQDPREKCESHLNEIVTDASKKPYEMPVTNCLFLTAHSFYTYMAKIIGGVGACVVCKCSDSSVTEKATTASNVLLDEIQKEIKEAWKDTSDSGTSPKAMKSTALTPDLAKLGSKSLQ